MAANTNIEALVVDALLERPTLFEAGGRSFKLYQPTLGKSYMLSGLIEKLGINALLLNMDPTLETLRLASEKRDIVSLIIAYSVCQGPAELFNKLLIDDLVDFFACECDCEDRALLLNMILTQDHTRELQEFFGIDKEHQRLKKCQRAKKDKSTLVFCGRSPWGSTIDFACERYGWSVDYVLWGVSYTTLKMLMADNIRTLFLTDEERKKIHIALPGDEILDVNNMNADDVRAALNLK